MNKKPKMTNRSKNKIKGFVLIFFALCILFIVVLFILPDIICYIRKLLNIVLPGILLNIDDSVALDLSSYIQIMLTIISCIITALIALLAYILSKQIGNLQFEEQTAKRMLWATKLLAFICNNMRTVWKYATLNSPQVLNDLETDDNDIYLQYIFNLFASKLIDKEDKKILEDCLIKFKVLKSKCETDENIVSNVKSAIINDYFIIGRTGEDYTFKESLSDIVEKLKLIEEKGDSNEQMSQ